MKIKGACLASVCFVTIFLISLINISPVHSGFLYKSYVIRYDRGWDILCDPYIVKKNDWLIKLFRQKGEISHTDFPEFLQIFKRLNPHINDIDNIRPGQHILIPLKKVNQYTISKQSTGVVTIPFLIDFSRVETLKKYSSPYRVRKGDFISVLISRRFKGYGSHAYEQALKLFRIINPRITNLNKIYAGQMIFIPDPAIQNQPWYPSLFNRTATYGKPADIGRSITPYKKTPIQYVVQDRKKQSGSQLSKVASALDAKLFNKGTYYFPRPGMKDEKIDLSQSPFMELKDGTRLFFPTDAERQESEITMVRSFWKGVNIVKTIPDDSLEHVFDAIWRTFERKSLRTHLSFFDHGVKVDVRGMWMIDQPDRLEGKERYLCITLIDHPEAYTPSSILHYLGQHGIIIKEILKGKNPVEGKPSVPSNSVAAEKIHVIKASGTKFFVRHFLTAMGYKYAPDLSISFPYAGMQITAVSNLAAKSNENSFLVDFGEFYGDAIPAIEKAGFNIVQIKNKDGVKKIIEKLFNAMNVSFNENPVFWVAQRSSNHNIALTIPGFLMDDIDGTSTLVTLVPLNNNVVQFLTNKKIKIIRIKL